MNKIELNITTNIETVIFYSILKFLKENGWKLTAEYDENIFDKGIDFDLYQFSKNKTCTTRGSYVNRSESLESSDYIAILAANLSSPAYDSTNFIYHHFTGTRYPIR